MEKAGGNCSSVIRQRLKSACLIHLPFCCTPLIARLEKLHCCLEKGWLVLPEKVCVKYISGEVGVQVGMVIIPVVGQEL